MRGSPRPGGASKRNLERMPDEEFTAWILSRMDICQCYNCPTHNECAKKSAERLYCVASRSPMCIDKRLGCLCHDCPVHLELSLKEDYHCLKGPEIKRS
ncbi:MAG: DUF2769 domain-containing protein [Methanomassiliicoccales archaeon]